MYVSMGISRLTIYIFMHSCMAYSCMSVHWACYLHTSTSVELASKSTSHDVELFPSAYERLKVCRKPIMSFTPLMALNACSRKTIYNLVIAKTDTEPSEGNKE